MKIRTSVLMLIGTVVLAACQNGLGGNVAEPSAPAEAGVGGMPPLPDEDAGSGGTSQAGTGGGSNSSGGTAGQNADAGEGNTPPDDDPCGCPSGNGGTAGQPSNQGGTTNDAGVAGMAMTDAGTGGEATQPDPQPSIEYVAITIDFTAVSGHEWDGMSVYLEAVDDGKRLPKLPPYGPEDPVPESLGWFDWAIAGDGAVYCSAQNANELGCTVHVPADATVYVNVHQAEPGTGLWACDAGKVLIGDLAVRDVNGDSLPLTPTLDISNNIKANAPCAFRFMAPSAS
jgi:hypothetical protein